MADSAKSRRHTFKASLTIAVCVLCAGLLVGSGFLYAAYRQAVSDNPTKQDEQLIQKIRENIELPDETPSVVTVEDSSKLSNPALARKTRDGDELIIFKQAQRIIIYRPDTGKIIDMLAIQAVEPAETLQSGTQKK